MAKRQGFARRVLAASWFGAAAVGASICQLSPGECFAGDCLAGVCDPCCGPDAVFCEGDSLWTRSQLTGDWFGFRTDLKDNGITLDADNTQFYMGVVHGGVARQFNYAGHADYVLNVDAHKAGGPEGFFVKMRAEHRWGEAIGPLAGAILPPAIASDLPTPISEEVYVTSLLFTQALSEQFAVFAGKMDTLDGDANAYASGRGKTQFSNISFVANPLLFRTVPYSTVGAGFAILGEGAVPIFQFSVLNPIESTRTTGLEELFAEGVTVASELRLPYSLGDLPGHLLFGSTWSSRSYVALDQDPRVILPSVPIAKSSGSWSLYGNFDQTLVTNSEDDTKGWGVFGRAGIGDNETNPISWFLSGGVGGNSPLCGRSADRFGVGWSYLRPSPEIAPFLEAAIGGLHEGQSVELFYNAEVTPWFHLTPDVQYLIPARAAVEPSWLIGLRGQIIL